MQLVPRQAGAYECDGSTVGIPGCYPIEAVVSAAGDTPATTETEFAARTRAGNESVPRHSELREKK